MVFQLWKQGPRFISKCFWGSFQSESWFNQKCTMVHLTAHQLNPGALSIEQWLTLKWTLTPFQMNPGPFLKLKNPKKRKNNVLKTKTKIGKAIILKIYLLVYSQKLIFNLGIPSSFTAKFNKGKQLLLLSFSFSNLYLREGLKTRLLIHIFWISILSPPPSHVGRFYDIILKFKYYPHRLTPPPLALIHISNFYNILYYYLMWVF